MNNDIMNNLQEQYNYFVEEYGEDRILWVAATGKTVPTLDSYGNVPAAACYLPTENELFIPDQDKIDNKDLVDIRWIQYNDSQIIFTPYKIINPKYEELLINNLFINPDILINDDELISVIKMLLNFSFAVPAKEQELIEKLTKTEKKALSNIIKDFNGNKEGDIKVSSATEKYNISTAVFRTLFYKLKEYGVAAIDSRGVKGTHICFNNIEIIKSLID